jgi:prolyl-tRNA editing enzyme YbaK/EbsC (Cys-tRNA(Pro) deacylase)
LKTPIPAQTAPGPAARAASATSLVNCVTSAVYAIGQTASIKLFCAHKVQSWRRVAAASAASGVTAALSTKSGRTALTAVCARMTSDVRRERRNAAQRAGNVSV